MSYDFDMNFMDEFRNLKRTIENYLEHHEPKEKCWCKSWSFPETINLRDDCNRNLKAKFCPECGRKL